MPTPYNLSTVVPVGEEAWHIAAEMIPVLERLSTLNARLWKVQEHSAGAKPTPFHPTDLADAIRRLRRP
jgi:hypothetical protein